MGRIFTVALLFSLPIAAPAQSPASSSSARLQTAVTRLLHPSIWNGVPASFKDVHASVRDGIVILTGSVDLLRTKLDVAVEVSHVSGVQAVQNRIDVRGPGVSDRLLEREITNRVHAKTVSIAVKDAVVIVEGQNVAPQVAWAAVATAANTPGVHGIVDHLRVTNAGSPSDLGQMPYTISSLP